MAFAVNSPLSHSIDPRDRRQKRIGAWKRKLRRRQMKTKLKKHTDLENNDKIIFDRHSHSGLYAYHEKHVNKLYRYLSTRDIMNICTYWRQSNVCMDVASIIQIYAIQTHHWRGVGKCGSISIELDGLSACNPQYRVACVALDGDPYPLDIEPKNRYICNLILKINSLGPTEYVGICLFDDDMRVSMCVYSYGQSEKRNPSNGSRSWKKRTKSFWHEGDVIHVRLDFGGYGSHEELDEKEMEDDEQEKEHRRMAIYHPRSGSLTHLYAPKASLTRVGVVFSANGQDIDDDDDRYQHEGPCVSILDKFYE